MAQNSINVLCVEVEDRTVVLGGGRGRPGSRAPLGQVTEFTQLLRELQEAGEGKELQPKQQHRS